jgi:hypothetical protein
LTFTPPWYILHFYLLAIIYTTGWLLPSGDAGLLQRCTAVSSKNTHSKQTKIEFNNKKQKKTSQEIHSNRCVASKKKRDQIKSAGGGSL